MWLEHELLKDPSYKGLYCLSTSFRNEPEPVPGRHDLIFPMFEFEMHGDMDALIALEKEALEFIGFNHENKNEDHYENIAKDYGVVELDHDHEQKLNDERGSSYFIKNFPDITSPFWNMARAISPVTGDIVAKKVDVIIEGIETIGSAERSVDVEQMRHEFYNISNGNYSKLLFGNFTKERVVEELEEFLLLIPEDKSKKRSGGAFGLTRLITNQN